MSAADADRRVLVFAPIGRDAELTRELLARAELPCALYGSIPALCAAFEAEGGGALLMTEEVLDDPDFPDLRRTLARQPAWSDVPVLLFAGRAGEEMPLRTIRSVELLRNVTLLERPIRLAAVMSTIRAALRGRGRQYEVRDLLVQLHRARTEAESANRLKDEFLATLSHELRTPLNAILGWTSMLTRGQIDAERMPRVFEALDRNAQAQAQLIADVLDVSRIITGKLQLQIATVDLAEVVARAADAVRPAAAAKQVALELPDPAPCLARGDADRLQQIFWNILSNAVKFTPARGTVRVAIARFPASAVVTVTDTGVGIAPEFVPFVFDRFRQADQTTTRVHGGLGLGLAIVKHLTELHGGTVRAASDGLGRGAQFRVELPADAIADELAPAAATAEFSPSLAGRVILVVDDDASTREVLAAALEQTHARVELADSAAAAWAAVERRRPDLIVADLGMPLEDGFSFIRRMRKASRDAERIPAIALSAYADTASQQSALAAGFTAFLAKPARPHALLQLVAALLDDGDTHRTHHHQNAHR